MTNRPKNLNQKFDVLVKRHVLLSNLLLAIVFAVLITEPMGLLIGYSARKAEVACREMPFLLLLSFIFLTICLVFVVKAWASQQKYLDEGGATKISIKTLPPELQNLQKTFRLAYGVTSGLCFVLLLWSIFLSFFVGRGTKTVGEAYGGAFLFLNLSFLFCVFFFVTICCWAGYFRGRKKLKQSMK